MAARVGSSTQWTRMRSRACVEAAIMAEIEWEAWNCCEVVNDAERELLREVLESWSGAP